MSYRSEIETDEVEARATEPRRRGRNQPISAAIAVLILLAAITAVLWVGYRVMSRRAGGEVPLIRADQRPIKAPPAQPGGMQVPDQNIYILNRQQPLDSRVEQLLPSPEAPLPRPTAPEPALVDTPAPEAAPPAAPAAAVQPPPPPVSAQPAQAARTPPVEAVTPARAPALPPPAPAAASPPQPVPPPASPDATAPPKPAAPPTPAARTASLPPAAAGSGYRLQLGSVRSVEEAQREWDRLKQVEPELLGKLQADAVRADLGERGVFYRIEAGRFADPAEGERLCAELKQRNIGCILVRQ
ncbi:MAG TPA: SPOR domain-containing protein [Stellaceae bacterium]|nr:SPOR domain-containing protein [Stellaceae bacterium]